jgi:hypothetical protein
MPWSELFLAECSRLENSPTIETDARERRSNDDVEKAMDGFFNNLLVIGTVAFLNFDR